MTIHEAQQRLVFQLYEIYDNREAANIADMVMENLTGWKKIDRILNKQVRLAQNKIVVLEQYTTDLLAHKPVQYLLNEAWFCGLRFFVNEHVLIPRPETEELVEWMGFEIRSTKYEVGSHETPGRIFDIGTGSGCISIALKKQFPSAEVYACDISRDALEVAQKNASIHQADIGFLYLNFLDPSQWEHLPSFNFIVSNPPYIPLKDKTTMRENVLQYEPHLALFAEDDPLLFYRAIADFGKTKMNPGGIIFAELHEDLAAEVQQVFVEKYFSGIELKKDMQGKNRMISVMI